MSNAARCTCSSCGKTLRPMDARILNGAYYCPTCLAREQEALLKLEQDQTKLLSYITRVFTISEVPESVVTKLWNEVKGPNNSAKKTIKGIAYTIRYVYEIKDNPRDIDWLLYNISIYYEESRRYWKEQMEIAKINREHVSTAQEDVISIKRPESKRKPDYNIEDL